jgi:hypothetical protein
MDAPKNNVPHHNASFAQFLRLIFISLPRWSLADQHPSKSSFHARTLTD